ncbi:A disintegrin and metalloproteinase with thrombospondin motifs 1 [Elysia marginata]|uniref:A disintegrin and metalloproteinase with thrombospondin motifs 1 n=1 Tax=Elysia marginata TaxID=1093978 RepID=A0AAV4IG30_9GAST|nr:A disintegrin and metalloproteinase with thrombospondin motifs 1 [Elysia marginata]
MKNDDGVDNDCDGNVDEEIKNYEDDDMDGKADEDVGTNASALHGGWGVWSPWDCWAPCSEASRYRRYRLCDRPSPSKGGRGCTEEEVEYSNRVCDFSSIPCLEDCPSTKWGEYCILECPRDCLDQRCDKTTGRCQGCKPGRTGDQCHMGEQNCSQSKDHTTHSALANQSAIYPI